MKSIFSKKLFLILFPCLLPYLTSGQIRVACIGNSITYGAFLANPAQTAYPAQLQEYLGLGYEVKNFGVSGHTLLSKGDYPYIKSNAYAQSLKFNPDIVLIKLGTNDSKRQNRQYIAGFKHDYTALIERYKALSSHPRIILLTPLKSYVPVENKEIDDIIDDSVIEEEIIPLIEELAYDNQLEIIHLHNLFGEQWQSAYIPDRIHPSAIGSEIMARYIGEYLTQPSLSDSSFVLPADAKPFSYHGFRGFDFQLNDVSCKIVIPHVATKGNPWIWRARFWGHEPQTDLALLERGFHIAYCDVADLFGSPKAIKRWDTFYTAMTDKGLNRKVVLEGMSRGGLIVYNWAVRHPKQVACIYADAPVMDIKSWPLANGDTSQNPEPVEAMMKAYNFKSLEKALKWKGNPLNHVKTLAKAHIPILHVVGDADDVVPVADNTALFEKAMAAAGSPITVIHKPGIGHHPHSLYNPQPIVQFILRATGHMPEEP